MIGMNFGSYSLERNIYSTLEQGRRPVTVCIATLCQQRNEKGEVTGSVVLGASDRRITYGDIEYEPPTTKVLTLTSSIVLMSSCNDATLQSDILRDLQSDVHARISENPTIWLTVKQVAELYAHHVNQARLKRAEACILAPLGLTASTFLDKSVTLQKDLTAQLAAGMQGFKLPYLGVIVTGVDSSGAHIYVVESGPYQEQSIGCYDSVGFAAIGSGAQHANSQLMLASHAWHLNFPETLGLIYIAKKRAEKAPGVGKYTDMFMIGPHLGSYVRVGDHVHKKLASAYEQLSAAEQDALTEMKTTIDQFVSDITNAQQQAPQGPVDLNASTSE